MASATELYQAIKALLLDNFATDYPAVTIMQGYLNNVSVPTNGQFIIMTRLSSSYLPVKPVYNYDTDNEEENYTTLSSTEFQIDFYGSMANDTAEQFKLILDSYATEFFSINSYACSVHKSGDVINFTGDIGREMYQPRYMLKFSLFNNITTINATAGIDTLDIDLRFADVQEGLT
jgi:hypothetical protein